LQDFSIQLSSISYPKRQEGTLEPQRNLRIQPKNRIMKAKNKKNNQNIWKLREIVVPLHTLSRKSSL